MVKARVAKLSEADLKLTCTELLAWDGWRCLNCETVYDGRRGRGFGEVGMPDSLYIRYRYDVEREAMAELMRLSKPRLHLPDGKPLTDFYGPTQLHSLSESLWIEWKSARGVLKPHQAKWHDLERARGALTKIAGLDFPASIEGFRAWYTTSGLLRRSI